MRLFWCLVVSAMSLFVNTSLYALGITDGMVAYWQFEGNANDSSAIGNDGVIYGDTTFVNTNPLLGQSVYMDGSGDYITVADDDSLDFTTAFSATMWINPSTVDSGWKMLFGKWLWNGGTARNYDFRLSNDDIFVGLNQSWSTISADVQLNEWQQVAFSYDGNIIKVYLNGEYIGEWQRTGPLGVNETHLVIGGIPYRTDDSVYSGWHYYGYMDEFKLFNRALSEDEILQEYNYIANGEGEEPAAVPEPAGIVLLSLGLVSLIKRRFFE